MGSRSWSYAEISRARDWSEAADVDANWRVARNAGRALIAGPLTEAHEIGSRFVDQAAWNRGKARAGERGGARVGKPSWLRILTITGGSSIAARIFKAPPRVITSIRGVYVCNPLLDAASWLLPRGVYIGEGLSRPNRDGALVKLDD